MARDIAQPVETFVEGPIKQERVRSNPCRTIPAEDAKPAIEQIRGHGAACAAARLARQGAMTSAMMRPVRGIGNLLLDFALPPRCAGCGEISEEVGSFCTTCWRRLEWLGNNGCQHCGLPLAGTEAETCGRCLADPPKIDRIRAAVAYDEIPRSVALRLKYGRKVALARTMARYMAPLMGEWGPETVIIPVPLHRWRLWDRGFNQSGLVARELARNWGMAIDQEGLRRVKRTRPLKGMSPGQRRDAVAGAFKVACPEGLKGKTVVLVDDVLTSGSTSEACARVLRRAGASRIELICWARVVRPAQLMR